jgi:hypothetical protein
VVQVDTNGTVLGPTNFWQANQASLLQALALPPYVQTDSGGVIVNPANPANFWQEKRSVFAANRSY